MLDKRRKKHFETALDAVDNLVEFIIENLELKKEPHTTHRRKMASSSKQKSPKQIQMVEIEDLYGKSSMSAQHTQTAEDAQSDGSEEEHLNASARRESADAVDSSSPTSWYDKFMMFKPLGLDKFDKQVLSLI